MGTGLPSPSPVTTQQRPMAARNSRLPEGSWTGRQDRSLKEGRDCPPSELDRAVSLLHSCGSQTSRPCGSPAGPVNTARGVQRPVLARDSAFASLSSEGEGSRCCWSRGHTSECGRPGARREGPRGEERAEGREGGRSRRVRDLGEGDLESEAQREGAGVEAEAGPRTPRGRDRKRPWPKIAPPRVNSQLGRGRETPSRPKTLGGRYP